MWGPGPCLLPQPRPRNPSCPAHAPPHEVQQHHVLAHADPARKQGIACQRDPDGEQALDLHIQQSEGGRLACPKPRPRTAKHPLRALWNSVSGHCKGVLCLALVGLGHAMYVLLPAVVLLRASVGA